MELLSSVFILLVTLDILAAANIDCGGSPAGVPPGNDPCMCASLVILSMNGSSPIGTVLAVFNSSFTPVLTECAHSFANISGNSLILQEDVRKGCIGHSTCKLQCTGSSSNKKDLNFQISYQDEYAPEFPRTSFNTTVRENAEKGSLLFDFSTSEHKPNDKDCLPVSFNFAIVKGSCGNGKFEMTAQGQLRLNQTLDYETDPQECNVTIRVENNGNRDLPGTTELSISVLDEDDNNPTFDQIEYHLNITEETVSSKLASSPPVYGYDMDTGINTTILYSFPDYKNSTDYLRINPIDGTFETNQKIDRENVSSFSLLLWCYQSDNRKKMAVSRLYVNVLDINDNAAVFSPVNYNVTLVENAIGYVTTVTAEDIDVGDNAKIFYTTNDSETFAIDESSGVITVKSPSDLDRETHPNIFILVTAHDLQGNKSSNTATVVVTLQDVNDNSPKFPKDKYFFHVNSTADGAFVGQVVATDDDEAATGNANVTYSPFRTGTALPLQIDELSGNISISGTFHQDIDYSFLITACDNPKDENDRRCTTVEVIVVYGKNVSFTTAEVNVLVSENTPVGTTFGGQLPITGDRYECSSNDFKVDLKTLMLVSNIPLDREHNETYHLDIDVYQYDLHAGNISVTITVLDVNDNAPVFSCPGYFFSFPDSKTSLVGILTASDKDSTNNASLSFSFQTVSTYFTIDSSTGEVNFVENLKNINMNKQSLYNLIAMVSDNGDPRLTSVVPVYISSMRKGSRSSVGIPILHLKQDIIIEQIKFNISRNMAEILGFDEVNITSIDYSSSLVYIEALVNGTIVGVAELQTAIVSNWSPIQDQFRQMMVLAEMMRHSNTDFSPSEIALLAIAVVILLGGLIAIFVICKQWNKHIKNQRLYDNLRRPSTMYDSQELRMDFGAEDQPSVFSSFRGRHRKDNESPLEGSFGLGYINTACDVDDDITPKTPTWSVSDTPRIPMWSTSDSLKDAMASLEELSNRLNSEDNISRISNMSRGLRSQKSSTKSEPVTPRSDAGTALNQYDPGYEPLAKNSNRNYSKLSYDKDHEQRQVTELENHDSGISEADRIQDIIEQNKMDDFDYEPVDSPRSLINEEDVRIESTAF